MSNNTSVSITYRVPVVLTSTQIEYENQVFDCGDSSCKHYICCSNLSSTNKNACQKCACQGGKFPSSGYCYRQGNGLLCSESSCSSICGDCTNAIIWGAYQQAVVSCSTAMSMQSNTSNYQLNSQSNATIAQVCNTSGIVSCCQGTASGGSAVCDRYWGPTDVAGNCDSIMTTFCNNNPTDSSCQCITSSMPVPECSDSRCTNSTAYKSSAMKSFQCNGFYMTCNQYNNIVNSGTDSYVNKNTISQSCLQSGSSATSSGSSQSTGGTGGSGSSSIAVLKKYSIYIAIAAAAVGLISITLLLSSSKSKSKKAFKTRLAPPVVVQVPVEPRQSTRKRLLMPPPPPPPPPPKMPSRTMATIASRSFPIGTGGARPIRPGYGMSRPAVPMPASSPAIRSAHV